jgi:acyl-CoA synthetase (AMP-forming)/AMP-acid ligase II
LFEFNKEDNWTLTTILQNDKPELVKNFIKNESPGLIVFTSGSTGKPKGILHDCERVIKKFVEIRQSWITVLFLMMDHFGGFNTMLSSFAYGGVGVCLKDRTPEFVCNAIQESKATLLPTTPTFLNLLLASKCYLNYDLSSISLITYGTEMMSPTTLEKVLQVFPKASIKQTYGLSELGVLRSKSESDDSVWVKIGGSGFETKIVDNMLWVKSEANMIGYLNAPNPIDEKGWFNTGDVVEVKGEFIRFMGRKSEIINVGGQKVFPIEVESILLQAENIKEATVYGEKHPLMGNVVHARITLYKLEEHFALTERLRKFCIEKMAKYKVPLRFHIVSDGNQHNVRFKKIRK